MPRWTTLAGGGQGEKGETGQIARAIFRCRDEVDQAAITLVVFAGFSVLYLMERLNRNHALGFAFILAGSLFIFHKWS